ncbi:hypothetical protein BN3659_01947 [Alistipes sp. CHKCI003]|nr:hypothetical protein BN3659_01947 [Alistipes sp. CHKCI003]
MHDNRPCNLFYTEHAAMPILRSDGVHLAIILPIFAASKNIAIKHTPDI